MSEETHKEARPVLRRHHLAHIRELVVDPGLFAARFRESCAMMNCTASCCTFGVYVDLAEREKILAHADQIIAHMDPHQVKDTAEWFEQRTYTDADFPSGRTVGTRAMPYGCVFLNGAGKCILQVTEQGEGLGQYFLKPFYCVAYPISIEGGMLTIENETYLNHPGCCRPTAGGSRTVFDVCAEELQFVLGPEGVEELRDSAGSLSTGTA